MKILYTVDGRDPHLCGQRALSKALILSFVWPETAAIALESIKDPSKSLESHSKSLKKHVKRKENGHFEGFQPGYMGPITVSSRSQLRAVAVKGDRRSAAVEATFLICHCALPDEIIFGTLRPAMRILNKRALRALRELDVPMMFNDFH